MRKYLIGFIAGAVLLLAGLITLQFSYTASKRYVTKCCQDNSALLESLVEACREYDTGESGGVSLDTETAPESVRNILESLRAKYQPDSEYAVFSSCKVNFDDDGNMQLWIRAKTETAAGDGHTAPDLRVCYLVYLDDKLAEDQQYMKKHEQLVGNWYFWSTDTYSC